MSLDKATILHVQSQAVALTDRVPVTDTKVMLLPDNVGLVSLEKYQDQPDNHAGRFNATDLDSFVAYVKAHQEPRTQIFVDPEDMVAIAIFDHCELDDGQPNDPKLGWGKHRAILEIDYTPEWRALIKFSRHSEHKFTQRDFLDFMGDYAHCLSFSDADEAEILKTSVYQAIQKLEVTSSVNSTHTEKDYGAERGVMESMDVAGANRTLPETMRVSCSTHRSLQPTVIECRLMMFPSKERVLLGYRINSMQFILDQSREEFSEKIKQGLTGVPLWTGRFSKT